MFAGGGFPMMKIKVKEVGDGMHPSEVVVGVKTSSGIECLAVSRMAIEDGSLSIGYPITADNEHYLVELPRETLTGTWRVWVDKDQVIPSF
jgi:hypothetical protein